MICNTAKSHIFARKSALFKNAWFLLIKRDSILTDGHISRIFHFIFPKYSHFRWDYSKTLKNPKSANISTLFQKIADFRCNFEIQVKFTLMKKISAEMRLFTRDNSKDRVSWPTESFDFSHFSICSHFNVKSTSASWGGKYDAKMTDIRFRCSQISIISLSVCLKLVQKWL